MAYSKQTWENLPNQTTPITAERLNHMEDGIYEASQGGSNIEIYNEYNESTTDGYSCNYVNELNTYSTDEIRVGTWVDGKPIYRKVIDFGALPNNTSKQVNHNISNLDKVITMSGYSYTSSSVYYPLPLQFKGSDSSYNVEMSVTDTYVGMISNTNRSSFSAYVILEYTKTTD